MFRSKGKMGLLACVLLLPVILNAFYRIETDHFEERINNQQLPSDSLAQYVKNKILPKGYERQALIALSYYPELMDVPIEFKMVDARSPFVSRPTFLSTIFSNKTRRHYLVLISSRSEGMLGKILIDKMSFDAQVGVLGHELAHTANFIHRSFFSMVGVIMGNLSSSYLDKFEYATDQRAIDHHMGCHLLAWSNFIVGALAEYPEFKDSKERYMRPQTIRQKLGNSNDCKNFSTH